MGKEPVFVSEFQFKPAFTRSVRHFRPIIDVSVSFPFCFLRQYLLLLRPISPPTLLILAAVLQRHRGESATRPRRQAYPTAASRLGKILHIVGNDESFRVEKLEHSIAHKYVIAQSTNILRITRKL
jgi:hypothetical protein